jgi:hypothetical protein
MKKGTSWYWIYLLVVGLGSLTACTNTEPVSDAPAGSLSTDLVKNPRSLKADSASSISQLGRLVFDDTLHDFGRMKAGEVVTTEFAMTNTGQQDLIIYDAKVGCGCTVPEYPDAPIKPGASQVFKVRFNSEGKTGYNDKTVLVHTNGDPAIYTLHILAEVQ